MKKLHIGLAISTLLITSNIYALDLSLNKSKSRSYDQKQDLQTSEAENTSDTSTDNESTTKTDEKSLQNSRELTKIEQTTSLIAIRALETSGVEPFKSCQVLSKPRLVDDFGLSCRMFNGKLNKGRCASLDSAAKSNYSLDSVVSDSNIFKLKQYVSCVALTGSLIAQDMIDEKFSVLLTNQELLKTFEDFTYDLENSECRLAGSTDSIQCGSVLIKLGYEPNVLYSNISLYSNQTYFGYSSRQMRNKSKRVADTFSLSNSKQKSLAVTLSQTLTSNQSELVSIKSDSAKNLSLSKFIPGE